jgi:hypothetical protein
LERKNAGEHSFSRTQSKQFRKTDWELHNLLTGRAKAAFPYRKKLNPFFFSGMAG